MEKPETSTVATLVDRLRSLSLEIEGLGYSRAREGWHGTVREAADRIEWLEKQVEVEREARHIAEDHIDSLKARLESPF